MIATGIIVAAAADVTTWPGEGITLLVLIVVLFGIAALLVNVRGRTLARQQSKDVLATMAATAGETVEDRELPVHDV